LGYGQNYVESREAATENESRADYPDRSRPFGARSL